MIDETLRARVLAAAERDTPAAARFLRDLIAIPSESAAERAVVARAADEMRALGFDEVKIDGFGNVLGRVGHGPRVVAIDGQRGRRRWKQLDLLRARRLVRHQYDTIVDRRP